MTRHLVQTAETRFLSAGTVCRAALHLPASDALTVNSQAPCVVMAHGFGAVRQAGLEPFAERFAQAGMYVLVFDYRHFGTSDGEPRQLLSVKRQLQDWCAAIRFARTLDGVDPNRVALWGCSFSGGHVVEAAVADGGVAALVSLCPMMDGLSATRNFSHYAGAKQLLRITGMGALDMAQSVTRRGNRTVPIVAPPDELAALSTPDAARGYDRITPAGVPNEVCARFALTLALYRPGLKTRKLRCPILIQLCTRDDLAPPRSAEAAAKRAGPRAEVKRYPGKHFDVYVGELFERAVADQAAFLSRHLAPA